MKKSENQNAAEAPMDAGIATGRKKYSGTIVPGMDPDAVGLVCPDCGCQHFRVVYTRKAARGRIMRRRECRHCFSRFTTMEISDNVEEPK